MLLYKLAKTRDASRTAPAPDEKGGQKEKKETPAWEFPKSSQVS